MPGSRHLQPGQTVPHGKGHKALISHGPRVPYWVMAKGTVLVVDDERKIRDTVTLYLERDGYDVLQAASGEAALKAARPRLCDLVVLDLMLPDLSGEEVAVASRAISTVPIIMLTAKAQEEDRIAGLRSGADDYLVKPFSPRELIARVDAVVLAIAVWGMGRLRRPHTGRRR